MFGAAFVVVWLACSIVAYGLTLGHFRATHPEEARGADTAFALFMAVVGPFGVLAATVNGAWEYPMKFR